jgi:demethylmenaquinone methyltransferase/2-methoxy-6-polyprenyl-1,4-benzoquinol methylase
MKEWTEKQRTMRHYDLQAKIYNVQYLGEQNAKIEELLPFMNLESTDYVLDLGCGTGFLFPYVAQKVGVVVGLDLSQKALKEAKERAKMFSNVFLVRADADVVPFIDDVFDDVFAVTVLQNMANPKITIVEMKRTAKATGTFAITGLKKKFTQESFISLLHAAKLKIVALNTNEQLKGFVAVCTPNE